MIKPFKPKVKVVFTEKAWLKMQTLIGGFSTEVAWHGLVARGKSPFEYIVYDILVYPQKVSSTTVVTDQSEYEKWLMNLSDSKFNNLRMQGHSHVNMPAFPSGKDRSLYDQIAGQMENDMFYIFLIWNKRGERNIEIHDSKANKVFHNSEITTAVRWSVNEEFFLRQAKTLVKVPATERPRRSILKKGGEI